MIKVRNQRLLVLCTVVHFLLFFPSCHNDEIDLIGENIYFSNSDNSGFYIHPFLSDSGYVLVVPSFWNLDSISIRSSKESCSINDFEITDRWQSISLKDISMLKYQSRFRDFFVYKSNLDAMCVQTQKGSLDSISKIISDSGKLLAISKTGQVHYNGLISSIKGRGNTTWLNSDKKPYKFKLKEKASLFGLRSGKKYNLLAESFDETKMHNWIALHIAEDFGIRFPIHCNYVSLWCNGRYQGIYLLTEPVDVGKKGININDLEKQTKLLNKKMIKAANMQKIDKYGKILPSSEKMEEAYSSGIVGAVNPDDITGGYVVEFLPWTKEPDNKFNTPFASLCLKSPKYPTIEQMYYIQHRVTEMLSSVVNGDEYLKSDNPSFLKYLNIDSYARYYLLQEVLYGCDACYASVYHVKDKDAVDSLFYAAPAWDFDISMSPYYSDTLRESNCYILRPMGKSKILLFPDLYNYKCFQDTVKSLYTNEMSHVLHHYFDDSYIDSLYAVLWQDVYVDSYRWNNTFTFPTAVSDLKRFMTLRIDFLDKDMRESKSKYYNVTVDKGIAVSPAHSVQWHVHKGDTFYLPQYSSYFYTLEEIVDDDGNVYNGVLVPKSDLNLHYIWRESTKFERAIRKVQKWLE